MAHDVFISYSTADKPSADAVCALLESRGIRCWIAPRDVTAGAEWAAAIMDAIGGATMMVVVFSNHTNGSQQVMREVERAVSQALVIVPFRLEDVPFSKTLAYFLGACHWLDALTPPLEKHIKKLADTVVTFLKGDVTAAESTIALHARSQTAHRDSQKILSCYQLGNLLEHTDWVLKESRSAALEPLQLALNLADDEEATRVIWKAAEDVSKFSPRAKKDLYAALNIEEGQPADYALFVAGTVLHQVWSDILLLCGLPPFSDEMRQEIAFYRRQSYSVMQTETRAIAKVAQGLQPDKSAARPRYEIDAAFLTLAAMVGKTLAAPAATVFICGAAAARIRGALNCIGQLSELSTKASVATDDVCSKMWGEAMRAYESLLDHAKSLGISRITSSLTTVAKNKKYSKRAVRAWKEMVADLDLAFTEAFRSG